MQQLLSDWRRGFVLLGMSLAAALFSSSHGLVSSSCSLADDRVVADKAAKDPPKNIAKADNVTKADKGVRPQPAVVTITPEREAAAVAFARGNHPELAALLDGLKRNAPREYHAALVDLDRAVERIGKIKEKSPDRHQLELSEWKITSRIRLLAARLSMSSDPIVETELRTALRERLELRLSAQRAERDRFQSRVTRLDQQIEEMSSRADATVEKQFVELRKTLPAARPSAKTKTKKPVVEPVDAKGEQK